MQRGIPLEKGGEGRKRSEHQGLRHEGGVTPSTELPVPSPEGKTDKHQLGLDDRETWTRRPVLWMDSISVLFLE